jgi:hypothetical protein
MPTAEHSRKRPARTGRVDWDRVDATTEKDIASQIAEDPDTAPEVTEEAMERAVVVSPDGRRTPYRERVGDPRTPECLRPGTKAPRSGTYEIIGASGERTGVVRTVAAGEPLPPTPASGQRYQRASLSTRSRRA